MCAKGRGWGPQAEREEKLSWVECGMPMPPTPSGPTPTAFLHDVPAPPRTLQDTEESSWERTRRCRISGGLSQTLVKHRGLVTFALSWRHIPHI